MMLRNHPNPLIAAWWRDQVNWRRPHRSSLVGFGVAVGLGLLLAGAALTDARLLREINMDPEALIFTLFTVYSILLLPVTTAVPHSGLLRLLRRWDRQSHLEPLLVTPISSGEWVTGLLVRTTLPTLATWLALCALLLMTVSIQFGFVDVHSRSFTGEMFGWLIYGLFYIPLQCLWSFAITGMFATRHRSIAIASLLSSLCLAAPFLLFLLVGYTGEAFWGPLILINVLKLVITVPLLAGLRRSIVENLRARCEG